MFFEASRVLESTTAKGAPMFVEGAVTIKPVWTPPAYETAIKLFEKDETALRIYGAAFAEYERAADGKPVHRVGGNPLPVQAPMEEGRERLLLQLDSDEDSESSWGDDGRLYFLLKRPGPFEKARCVLQSG
jgi:hypothetical protein